MELIVKPFKDDEVKLLKLGVDFLTFEDRYSKWINTLKKKKLGLCTPEFFSLGFNTTLKELKECLFIDIRTDKELNLIIANFNVIECN